MLHSLQHIVKKLSQTYTVPRVKYYLDNVIFRAQVLSLRIRFYSTHDLFPPQESNSLRGRRTNSKALPKLKVLV